MAIAFVALALFGAACGGSDEPVPAIAPEAALERSVAALAELTSFHFRLSHENGTTAIPLNLALESAEGDVVVPDRFQAELRASTGSFAATVEVISIGGETWITNPFTRGWQSLPGLDASDFADPGRLVADLVEALEEVELAGQASVDSATVYRLEGVLASEAVGDSIGSAQPGFRVGVELWVDAVEFLPRRVRLSGRLSDLEPADIVREIELSRFNAAVEINPP